MFMRSHQNRAKNRGAGPALLAPPEWIPLTHKGAFLLRCLERARVVDMQGHGSTTSPLEKARRPQTAPRIRPVS